MSREIIVRFTFDWDGYEGVDDELLIEDMGFRIEEGVTWEILKNDQPYTAEDIQSFYIWANANGFYCGELTGVWYNDETEDEVYAIEEVLTKWEEETK